MWFVPREGISGVSTRTSSTSHSGVQGELWSADRRSKSAGQRLLLC